MVPSQLDMPLKLDSGRRRLNVTFRRDLIGPRLGSWNALLHLLVRIHLKQVADEFLESTREW
jgi:hypothetical protein